MSTLEEQCWELARQFKEKSVWYRENGKKMLEDGLPQTAATCRGSAAAFGDAANHLMEILKQKEEL